MSLSLNPISPISELQVPSVRVHVNEVTDATFEAEVLKSNVPVLVYFWAPYYPSNSHHCVTSAVEHVANNFNGKLKVVTLNVDANKQTTRDYLVHSIPKFILFKEGQMVDRYLGAIMYLRASLSFFVKKHI